MENYYNLDDIKTMLNNEIEKESDLLKAWKAVTFPTKKDGAQFKVLSKNIVGAKIFTSPYAMQPGENILSVRCASATDSIDLYTLVNDLKTDDPRKSKMQNYQTKFSCLNQIYIFDLEDIKEAVKLRIEHLEKRIKNLQEELAIADDVFNTFRSAYVNAVKQLEKSSNKSKDSTLFYAVLKTVKNNIYIY